MPDTGDGHEKDPLVRPHLIRFLRDRPRLIDDDFRKEVLDNIDRRMTERRRPDTVAERTAENLLNQVKDVTKSPIKDRTRRKLEEENVKRLRRV